jgi:2-polyprenyl-3-methyl-5-hydroxy-6-metoxy-1,4-benzoquinol methylase
LTELENGARILEVGGGILALSIQLASEGFEVTSVEPVGSGFSDIQYLMDTFKKIAHNEKVKFDLLNLPIEECVFDQKFDFIFSINVMEHLEDSGLVFVSLASLLKPTAKYRFFVQIMTFPTNPTLENGSLSAKTSHSTSKKLELLRRVSPLTNKKHYMHFLIL